MQQYVLFLDIDGVINVSAASPPEFLSIYQGRDLYGYPVPLARRFLQAVDRAEWIKPLWLSSGWRQYATVWNQWAQTSPWRIGYPISFTQTRNVLAMYPKIPLDEIDDGKTIAALWHSANATRFVWIENGFPESALAWSQRDNRVTLINTVHPCDRSLFGIQAWNIDKILEVLNLELEWFAIG